jgi:hydrogenase expression/formation protein HypE
VAPLEFGSLAGLVFIPTAFAIIRCGMPHWKPLTFDNTPRKGRLMEGRERFGKLAPELLERVVFRNLGAPSQTVIVGPRNGFDNAVLSLGEDRRLILTSDPLSVIPSIGMAQSAWLSVHLLASDFTTTGRVPQFAAFDFNFPSELSHAQLGTYLKALSDECARLGVAIVGGHTGTYPGAGLTVVGGGVLLGVCREGEYLTPAMANDSDAILITKGAAIETTAVLANTFPKKIEQRFGGSVVRRARNYLSLCSTVKDALTAAEAGLGIAVTSMHDATEGGTLGGLHEHALASGTAFIVDTGRIFVSEETRKVCSLFGIDPMRTLSEGTLIITCRPDALEGLVGRLAKAGVPSFEVGRVEKKRKDKGLWLRSGHSTARRFTPSSRDPYWAAYTKGIRQNWF